MPNPGATTSFQSFEREHINVVVHVPDYRLRQQLALQHNEELIVEAFCAFDEIFHLHFRWSQASDYPELSLSLVSAHCQKFVLDLRLQSPQFTHLTGDGYQGGASSPPQFALCTWSAPLTPIEVRRTRGSIPLRLDRAPTYHNDINVGLEQTVVFTLNGMGWRLDDSLLSSLHCKSFRSRGDFSCSGTPTTAEKMIVNLAAMQGADDTEPEIEIILEDEGPAEACEDSCARENADAHLDMPPAGDTHGAVADETSGASGYGAPASSGSHSCPSMPCSITGRPELAEGSGGGRGRSDAADTSRRRVFVHAFVLQAHSPVFRRMLAGPMCEATAKSIKMFGVTPTELDDFAAALYGLAVPQDVREDEHRILGLLRIADRYEVLAITEKCANLLEQLLSETNMATFLKVADMHQAEGLRKAALQYIAERTSRIVSVMDSDDPAIRRVVRKYLTETDRSASEGGASTKDAAIGGNVGFAVPVGDADTLAGPMSEDIRV